MGGKYFLHLSDASWPVTRSAACDCRLWFSVTVVDIGRVTSSSLSSTWLSSLILLFLGKGCLIKFFFAFFFSTSYPKFEVGTEFAYKHYQQNGYSKPCHFQIVSTQFCLFKAQIHSFFNSEFLNMLGKQYNLNGGTQWMTPSRLQLLSKSLC